MMGDCPRQRCKVRKFLLADIPSASVDGLEKPPFPNSQYERRVLDFVETACTFKSKIYMSYSQSGCTAFTQLSEIKVRLYYDLGSISLPLKSSKCSLL